VRVAALMFLALDEAESAQFAFQQGPRDMAARRFLNRRHCKAVRWSTLQEAKAKLQFYTRMQKEAARSVAGPVAASRSCQLASASAFVLCKVYTSLAMAPGRTASVRASNS